MTRLAENAYTGAPGVNTRLFAMYHRATSARIKTFVLSEFNKTTSNI